MNKKNRSVQLGLGIPTILLIFIALCMATISVLIYLNASQNSTMTEREARYVEAYYNADSKAKRIVDVLNGVINTNNSENIAYIKDKYAVNVNLDDSAYTFSVKINADKLLSVKLDSRFNVLVWKVIDKQG